MWPAGDQGQSGVFPDTARGSPEGGWSPGYRRFPMVRNARKSLVVLVAAAAMLALAAARPAGQAGAAGPALPRLHSHYVRMPDGARLAVDVWLPPGTTAS